jgi:hypothetical protein
MDRSAGDANDKSEEKEDFARHVPKLDLYGFVGHRLRQ